MVDGTDLTSPQNEEKLTTAETIAEEYKVGKATVPRAEKFVDAVDAIAQNVGDDARDEILWWGRIQTYDNI